jgi:hypothetical protein
MLRKLAIALFLALVCAPAAFAQNDTQGSKDFPGVTRMPDYFIYFYEESPFGPACGGTHCQVRL